MHESRRLLDAVWASRPSLRGPIEETAASVGVDVYLVGGYLRDLLLGLEPTDLDLTVEGDGQAFARELAVKLTGTVRTVPRFLTAVVELPGGERIDVATARTETYETPGALPEVEPAPITADLERRDFTVNTFALGLGGGAVGVLLDSEQGRDDLRRRLLRVLHPASFVDDPTRVLRAVRLERGLDFRLAASSDTLARRALAAGAFRTVSGERLWSDLRPLLCDPTHLADACRRLSELGAIGAIGSGLVWTDESEELLTEALREGALLAQALAVGTESDRVVATALLVLLSKAPEECGRELADRLKLGRELRGKLAAWPRRLRQARWVLIGTEPAPSRVHSALEGLSAPELGVVAASLGPAASAWVLREVQEFRSLDLGIEAQDLLDTGKPPGPGIGGALERTRAARLDGEIGPGQELDYALGVLEGTEFTGAKGDESE